MPKPTTKPTPVPRATSRANQPTDPSLATMLEAVDYADPPAESAEEEAPAPPPTPTLMEEEKPKKGEYRYPEFRVVRCEGTQRIGQSIRPALTAAEMKEMLGWYSEPALRKHLATKHGILDADVVIPPEIMKGDKKVMFQHFLVDTTGNKVWLIYNRCNRPWDERLSKQYAQDILKRQWAGPISFPGETINGDTMVFDRNGQLVSAQHRGIGLIFAQQIWAQTGGAEGKWGGKNGWMTEPVLETLLVTGVSNAPEILRTVDAGKPRSQSDVYYTSFEGIQDLDASSKRVLAKMLATAVDLVWKRTQAGYKTAVGDKGKVEKVAGSEVYKSHSEGSAFVARHPKIAECVTFIHGESTGIRALKLLPGNCAGLMYLMAASDTDGDEYRNADERTEDMCNMDWFEKSKEFWALLAGCGHRPEDGAARVGDESFFPVVDALMSLVDEDSGGGGRLVEKHAIVVKAWLGFREGDPTLYWHDAQAGEALEYITDPKTNETHMPERPEVPGIDLGEGVEVDREEIELTQEEVDTRIAAAEAEKNRLRELAAEESRKRAEAKAKAEADKKAGTGLDAEMVKELNARKAAEVRAKLDAKLAERGTSAESVKAKIAAAKEKKLRGGI